MKIIISNDDGIESKGIVSLIEKFSVDNEILVVAPDENKSACSHSLTIHKRLKLNNIDGFNCDNVYTLSGTPADCIKFAKLHFNDFKSDVVISGINREHNIGSDTLYSGTVAIAIEASFFGEISFAFSAFNCEDEDFDLFSDYALKIVNKFLPLSEKGDIWNVNFPKKELGIKGIKVTKLGKQLYSDRYEKIGENEYMLTGEILDHNQNDNDCDIEWLKKGYITITPILFNKTNHEKIKKIKEKCIEL